MSHTEIIKYNTYGILCSTICFSSILIFFSLVSPEQYFIPFLVSGILFIFLAILCVYIFNKDKGEKKTLIIS